MAATVSVRIGALDDSVNAPTASDHRTLARWSLWLGCGSVGHAVNHVGGPPVDLVGCLDQRGGHGAGLRGG
jgi:hypothetical protein